MKAFVQAGLSVVGAIMLIGLATAGYAQTSPAKASYCSGGQWINKVCTCSGGMVPQAVAGTFGSFVCVQPTLSVPLPTLVCTGGQILTPKGCACPTGTIWNLKKAPPKCEQGVFKLF